MLTVLLHSRDVFQREDDKQGEVDRGETEGIYGVYMEVAGGKNKGKSQHYVLSHSTRGN